MSHDKRVRLARKLETKWFRMVSVGDKDADGLGEVVDSVFANDPKEALVRCREEGVSDNIAREIREVFGL